MCVQVKGYAYSRPLALDICADVVSCLRSRLSATHLCKSALESLNTRLLQVLGRMKQLMVDNNTAASHSFLLDDDSSIPFSLDDIQNLMDEKVRVLLACHTTHQQTVMHYLRHAEPLPCLAKLNYAFCLAGFAIERSRGCLCLNAICSADWDIPLCTGDV